MGEVFSSISQIEHRLFHRNRFLSDGSDGYHWRDFLPPHPTQVNSASKSPTNRTQTFSVRIVSCPMDLMDTIGTTFYPVIQNRLTFSKSPTNRTWTFPSESDRVRQMAFISRPLPVCDTCRLQTCRLADLQTCRLQTCRLQTCRLADLQTCRLADLQTCRLADCRLANSQTFVTSTNKVTLDNKIVTRSQNLKVLDNEFIVLKSRHGVALPFVCPIQSRFHKKMTGLFKISSIFKNLLQCNKIQELG